MYGDSYSARFAERQRFGIVGHPNLNGKQTVVLMAQSNKYIMHPSGLTFRIDKNEPITLDAGISYIASISEMQLVMSKGVKINIEEYAEYYGDAEKKLGFLFEQMIKGKRGVCSHTQLRRKR